MSTVYTDIGELVTNDPTQGDASPLGIIADAALVVDGDQIAWVGPRADAPPADRRVSCAGTSVIPGFVDSHAHLVFAGERSAEFAARMSGEPYWRRRHLVDRRGDQGGRRQNAASRSRNAWPANCCTPA